MGRNAKYSQVADWITKQIETGKLLPGDRLESENDICARFEVSRQTVRHALGILARDGIIESRQGSGSFVKEQETPLPARDAAPRKIVIVSTYVNAYIFPSVIQGMESVLGSDDYDVQIMFTHNRRETEKRILNRLLNDTELAGLIIEPTMSGLPDSNHIYYEQLQKKGIPLLFFHSFYDDLDIPHVSLDDVASGRLATEYLCSQGHTRIAGIFKVDDGQGRLRYRGYTAGLAEAGLTLKEKHVVWIDTEDQRHMELCRDKIVRRLSRCTACVCYNDEVAHALTELCLKEGIRIPEDLSLVSIDNSELARLNQVPLTSVRHPMEKLGMKVAENMLRMIQEPDFGGTFEFQPELEIRESVKDVRVWEDVQKHCKKM